MPVLLADRPPWTGGRAPPAPAGSGHAEMVFKSALIIRRTGRQAGVS